MSDRIRVVVADDQNISRGFFEMYVRAAIRYELLTGCGRPGTLSPILTQTKRTS